MNVQESGTHHDTPLVRLGGIAILVGLGIHIVLNVFLKEFPPIEPTAAELQAYLSQEAGNWAIVHGFRYIAFTCIILFAVGLYSRTCSGPTAPARGWGIVGLLGTAVFVTNGVISNGIETFAFLNGELLSQHQELFWLLFGLTRVLFTAEVVTWSILILGFSAAGSYSGTLPKWMSVLGYVHVLSGFLFGLFLVSALNGEWAISLLDIASLTGLVWFLCVGFYMLLKGAS